MCLSCKYANTEICLHVSYWSYLYDIWSFVKITFSFEGAALMRSWFLFKSSIEKHVAQGKTLIIALL